MKFFLFLINALIAQLIAVGLAHSARDKFSAMFYTVCICFLIWDLFLGIFYLVTPKQKRNFVVYRVLFSIASAWIVPIILIVALIFIPPQTLQSLLHFQ
jgi:low temperature requirement protein LtrA